jgi:hypothetical protein
MKRAGSAVSAGKKEAKTKRTKLEVNYSEEHLQHALENSEKANTKRTYDTYRKEWTRFTDTEKIEKPTLTDHNLAVFIASYWRAGASVSQIKGARSALYNACLDNGLPAYETANKHLYPEYGKALKSIRVDPRWISSSTKKAETFSQEADSAIFAITTNTKDLTILRDKVAYILMVDCKMRPDDAHSILSSHVKFGEPKPRGKPPVARLQDRSFFLYLSVVLHLSLQRLINCKHH